MDFKKWERKNGTYNSITNNLKACSLVRGFGKTHIQGPNQGVPQVHVHPLFKKKNQKNPKPISFVE